MSKFDDREFMLNPSMWEGAFICIKHKDYSITDDDPNKGVGVVLAVRDKSKGTVAVLLNHNIYMPLDSGAKVESINVDELLEQGWVVD